MAAGAIENFMNDALKFIRLISPVDIFDVLIVAIAIYYFMLAIRGTRAAQLVKGVLVVIVVYMLSGLLKMNTLNYILSALVQVAMFGVIVIFQPELRNLLEKMGRLKIGQFIGVAFDFSEDAVDVTKVISNISTAASQMAEERTGALIVVERMTRLGEYMNSGTVINADLTPELLKNIFAQNTPLHDGAVIVRGDKIITAGCVLPLTANSNLASELGTRHRAALGLSESSDAVIIVVSEETGKISVAVNGSLTRNLTRLTLNKALTKLLVKEEDPDANKKVRLRIHK